MSGRLAGSVGYLCGPIEFVKDYGAKWRDWITPKLRELGVGVLNPLHKPIHTQYHEDSALQTVKKDLIEKKDYNTLSKIMKEVVRADLRMVDKADFLVAYVDMTAHMCGSYHEIVIASIQRKPVLLVCKQGKINLSPWVFGIMNHENFFDRFEDMLEYLKYVNTTMHEIKGWHFFDFKKVFGLEY